jgi:hypothetical protein
MPVSAGMALGGGDRRSTASGHEYPGLPSTRRHQERSRELGSRGKSRAPTPPVMAELDPAIQKDWFDHEG